MTPRSLLFALFQLDRHAALRDRGAARCSGCRALPRFRFIIGWCRLNLWGARWICGIRHRVIGAENIPSGRDGRRTS